MRPQIQSNIVHKNDLIQNRTFNLKGGRLWSILEVQSKKLEDTTRRENSSVHIEQTCMNNNKYSLVTTPLADREVSNISSESSNTLFLLILRALLSIIVILLFGFNLLNMDKPELTSDNYHFNPSEASLEKMD